MITFTKILAGSAGLAALATAAPAAAAAQYYGAPYGNAYGYNNNVTNMAAQRCAAAVQSRLHTRTNAGGLLGAILGVNTATSGRVLNVTQVTPRRNSVVVRGLASSGRNMGYGQYGYGAYGAAGYAYQPDLSFRCSVDYNGYIRDVDVNRR
jgi:hypothetical protein